MGAIDFGIIVDSAVVVILRSKEKRLGMNRGSCAGSFALKSRELICAIAVGVLVIGGVTFHFFGSEFLPKLDEGDLWVRTFAPQSIAPSKSAKITQNVRMRLASFPEVRYVVSQLGRPDDGTDINGWDVSEYSVALKPREQ